MVSDSRPLEPPVTRDGLLYGLGAYIWWGLMPIYFAWLGKFDPLDFVAHRIVWSLLLLLIVMVAWQRWTDTIACFRKPRVIIPLCVSAVLVAYNWLMYVMCVVVGEIVQASLGYFILPLLSVFLAMFIFHERLRPLQYLAVCFAAVGVALLTWSAGVLPSLAIGLALSFSVYGMIRKKVPVDGLVGLTVETIVLAPIALGYLIVVYWQRGEVEDAYSLAKLSASGVTTAVPLLCFGQAARRLPLALLGFMQYIAPSIQFFLALWMFGEAVLGGWFNYGLVWTALLVFTLDSYLRYRPGVEPAVGRS